MDSNSEMDRVAGKCLRQRDASGCVWRTAAHMPGTRKEDMGGCHERGVFAADEEFGTGRKSTGKEGERGRVKEKSHLLALWVYYRSERKVSLKSYWKVRDCKFKVKEKSKEKKRKSQA